MGLARVKELLEKEKQKTRLEIIRSWFTSFAVTAVAVVAVVVFVPRSPSAGFERLEVFANQIIYSLQVTDEDAAIIEGTLKLVVENQMEYYETSLDLGQNAGIITSLRANTTYQIAIKADKGFGLETLDAQSFKTLSRIGGAIVGETLVSEPSAYFLDYDVTLYLFDPETEFKEFRLISGYMYPWSDEVYDSQELTLASGQTSVRLEEIPNENVKVILTLEGTRQNDETEILDIYQFHTPLNVDFSYSLNQVTTNSLSLYLYPESAVVSNLSFTIALWTGSRKVQEKSVLPQDETSGHHHSGTEVVFTGLRPATDYRLELMASYTNPYTMERITATVATIEETTLGNFSHTFVLIETDTHYQVELTVNDPDHNFQIAYYYVYWIQAEDEINYGGGQSGFTPSGEEKSAILTIAKPSFTDFRIEIGLRNQTDYYRYVIIENIRP